MAYPKSDGALFNNNNRAAETHPHWRGKLTVTKEQIDMLVQMGQSGLEPILQLGAWKRVSKAGDKYIFLSAEAYIPEGQPAPPPQQQTGGWGNEAPQQQAPQQQAPQDDGWGSPPPAPAKQDDDW